MADPGMVLLQWLVLTAMLVGMLSLLTTVIPGLFIVWVSALIYLLGTGLNWGSGIAFAFITVLWLVGSIADNVLMGAKARQTGASWWAIGISIVAGFAGTLIFPPVGGIILALLALFVVEFIRLRDWRKALGSTGSMAAGCGWAVLVRMAIAAVMIGIWLIWAF